VERAKPFGPLPHKLLINNTDAKKVTKLREDPIEDLPIFEVSNMFTKLNFE
jgi:hypothetical protein